MHAPLVARLYGMWSKPVNDRQFCVPLGSYRARKPQPKNDVQVAVAVKTLKVGSTVEEKIDFLSEAEMMKRFNHKNIVQLLGVCTRNEPVYTVMEFILYGTSKENQIRLSKNQETWATVTVNSLF